jgi:WD40 repeat protein
MLKRLPHLFAVMAFWCLVEQPTRAQPLPKARVDQFGDPLPDGAVARLGTTHWRLYQSPLTFAPNGQYAIVTSARIPFLDAPKPYGETTRLLDAATGTSMRMFPEPSWGAFFTSDNKVVILEHKNIIRFLNVETGRIMREIKINDPCAWFTGTTWSADGKRMACQYHNNMGFPLGCYVWDLEHGVELCGWEKEGGNCALSADGTLLAIRANHTIGVFSVDDKKIVCKWESESRAIVFLPDGKTLIAAESKRVLLLDPSTGQLKPKDKLGPILETARDDAATLATTADGRYLAAGGAKGTIYFWDLQAGVLMHTFPDSGKGLPIYNLNFTPDGKRLVSQTHLFPSARVWDVATGKELTPRDVARSNIDRMMFSTDGKILATTGQMDPIQLWDAASGKLWRNLEHPVKKLPFFNRDRAVVLTSSGKALVAAWSDEAIIWNLADGKLRHHVKAELPQEKPEHKEGKHFTWTNCCPDDDTIVAVFSGDLRKIIPPQRRSRGRKVYWTMIGIADANTGKIQRSFRVDPDGLGRTCLSPDGKMLAASGSGVRVWNLQSGVEILNWGGLPNQHGLESMAFSADSRTLFLTSGVLFVDKREHGFWVLDIASGKVRGSTMFTLDPRIRSHGTIGSESLAAISKGTTISLLNPLTGKEYAEVKTNLDEIIGLAFSADGKQIASAGDDTTALIWDISNVVEAAAKEIEKGTVSPQAMKLIGIAAVILVEIIALYLLWRFPRRKRQTRVEGSR